MAKDLPYFKFFCSEWNDGDITLEDFATQGVFINVCSYYWSNECNVSIEKLHKRFKHNTKEIDTLFESELIHNDDDFVSIHFLDEQQDERKQKSLQNSRAGKVSAEARKLARAEKALNAKVTSVEIPLNTKSTIKRREEEKREDNTKDDSKESLFDIFWTKYPKKVAKEKCRLKFNKLSTSDKDKILSTLDAYILYKPFKDYTHPNPETYLNQERWKDEIQTTSNKQQPASEDKFMQYVKMQQELYTPKN